MQLEAKDRLNQAEEAYVELIIAGGEGAKCALDGLDRIDRARTASETPPVNLCEVAEALLEAGRITEAESQYVEAMKTNATRVCAAEGLDKIDEIRSTLGVPALDTIRMTGTNWIPSVANPITSLGLWVGLLSLLALVFWIVRVTQRELVLTLAIVGIIAGVVAGFASDWFTEAPDCCAVVTVEPFPVPIPTGDVSNIEVGVAQADDGGTAKLTLTPNGLDASAAPRAGKYVGTADLDPARVGGEEKVELAVKDWAFWPLVVITLGVLIGWRISRYFSQRPQALGRIRRDELWRRASEIQAAFEAENAGTPQSAYSILAIARARVAEADGSGSV